MGIGGSTVALANSMIRKPCRAMLDLGTGCGVHAVLAADHCDRIVATDINPRAIAMTAFNAQLNGLGNIETRVGDRFAPVRGEKFDLIASNPPFVVSPENSYMYRDTGMLRDHFVRSLLGEAPTFLEEGGFCQILAQWVHSRDESWMAAVESSFNRERCDVWVLRRQTEEVADYALHWLKETEPEDNHHFESQFQRWMDYYDAQGIDLISFGAIFMRRTNKERSWFLAEEAPAEMVGLCGPFVLMAFELRDFLQHSLGDCAILDTAYKANPSLRIHQQYRPGGDSWVPDKIVLRLTAGFAYAGEVDPLVAAVTMQCDGRRSLRVVIQDVVNEAGGDGRPLETQLVRVAWDLIAKGFLLPDGIQYPI
jgi:hypothetical protein